MKTSFFTSDGSRLIADFPRPGDSLEKKLLSLENETDAKLIKLVLLGSQTQLIDKQDVLRSLDVVLACLKYSVSKPTAVRFDFFDIKSGLKLFNLKNMSGFSFDGRPASLNCELVPGECRVIWIGKEYLNTPINQRSRQVPGIGRLVDDNGKEVVFKNKNEASELRDIVVSVKLQIAKIGSHNILVTGA